MAPWELARSTIGSLKKSNKFAGSFAENIILMSSSNITQIDDKKRRKLYKGVSFAGGIYSN